MIERAPCAIAYEMQSTAFKLQKGCIYYLITLSGIIGSGKSSLTEILSKELGTKAYYEPVEDNPVLPIFTRATKLRPKTRGR